MKILIGNHDWIEIDHIERIEKLKGDIWAMTMISGAIHKIKGPEFALIKNQLFKSSISEGVFGG